MTAMVKTPFLLGVTMIEDPYQVDDHPYPAGKGESWEGKEGDHLSVPLIPKRNPKKDWSKCVIC